MTELASQADGLSPYEQQQIDLIARWKSTEPSRLTQTVELVAQPIAWGVKWAVPAEVVRRAIRLLNTMAESKLPGVGGGGQPTRDEIVAQRQLPLEACDQQAQEIIQKAEHISAGRGLVIRQLGNAVVGRLPFQLVAAMATIAKVGHSYGYPLDRPLDRAVLLDVLELSLIEDCSRREVVLARMHAALDHPDQDSLNVDEITAQAGRDVLADELADELVTRVPIIGSVIGFISDRTFIRIAGEAAIRFFQERRLRDEGRVAEILPAAVRQRRSSYGEISRAVSETVYAGGAIVGFAATFPIALVGRGLSSWGGPVTTGAAAGAAAASRDAAGLLHGQPEPPVRLAWAKASS